MNTLKQLIKREVERQLLEVNLGAALDNTKQGLKQANDLLTQANDILANLASNSKQLESNPQFSGIRSNVNNALRALQQLDNGG